MSYFSWKNKYDYSSSLQQKTNTKTHRQNCINLYPLFNNVNIGLHFCLIVIFLEQTSVTKKHDHNITKENQVYKRPFKSCRSTNKTREKKHHNTA